MSDAITVIRSTHIDRSNGPIRVYQTRIARGPLGSRYRYRIETNVSGTWEQLSTGSEYDSLLRAGDVYTEMLDDYQDATGDSVICVGAHLPGCRTNPEM